MPGCPGERDGPGAVPAAATLPPTDPAPTKAGPAAVQAGAAAAANTGKGAGLSPAQAIALVEDVYESLGVDEAQLMALSRQELEQQEQEEEEQQGAAEGQGSKAGGGSGKGMGLSLGYGEVGLLALKAILSAAIPLCTAREGVPHAPPPGPEEALVTGVTGVTAGTGPDIGRGPGHAGNEPQGQPQGHQRDQGSGSGSDDSCGSGRDSGRGLVFWDLGSGCGRLVLAAALLEPGRLHRCCGVELIQGLHDIAARAAQQLCNAQQQEQQAQGAGRQVVDPSRLLLLHGDILECSAWGDADLVLMNSTLFSHSLMARIEARATQLLRPGTVVVTLTKAFADQATWAVVQRMQRRMSWGHATVFVMVKVQ